VDANAGAGPERPRLPRALEDDANLDVAARHRTSAFALRHARNASLTGCSVAWGSKVEDTYTHALEAENVSGLGLKRFTGTAAHPERDLDIAVR
jgi:hypothetical protein